MTPEFWVFWLIGVAAFSVLFATAYGYADLRHDAMDVIPLTLAALAWPVVIPLGLFGLLMWNAFKLGKSLAGDRGDG